MHVSVFNWKITVLMIVAILGNLVGTGLAVWLAVVYYRKVDSIICSGPDSARSDIAGFWVAAVFAVVHLILAFLAAVAYALTVSGNRLV